MSGFSTPRRPSVVELQALREAEAGAVASHGLATYLAGGQERVGFVLGSRVMEVNRALAAWSRTAQRPIGGLLPVPSMQYLLERWDAYELVLRHTAVLLKAGGQIEADFEDLAAVSLLAPVPRPGKVLNFYLNFYDQAEEMGLALPEDFVPEVFDKGAVETVIGPSQPIRLTSDKVDWAAELAVVIGRPARNVPVEKALAHVAGYTCHNDVTDRESLFRPDGSLDFAAGKSRDTFAPLGPYLVPRYLVPQPEGLRVRCLVNGEVRQDYSMSQMHWSVARAVSHLSCTVGLEPGDVIGLGTGAGAGWAAGAPEARGPEALLAHLRDGGGVFLRTGDRVAVEVEAVGVLENEVV